MYNIMTMDCIECAGECKFEIEPPDYEVGLMGYSAIYWHDNSQHKSECSLNGVKFEDIYADNALQAFVDRLEEKASYKASEWWFDYE